MAVELSDVSRELATRLLSEVEFDDRLTGWEMRQMSGSEQKFIYGFQEALDFMKIPEFGDLFSPGAGGSIGYLDFEELRKWIAEVLGDRELAEAISEVQAGTSSYAEGVSEVGALMNQRLKQCRQILGLPTA